MQIKRIRSIRRLGLKKCLDLEVNHKDHNFYAEGLITSNSHSVAYSYLTALTALLKYRYPLYFYAALLNFPKKKNGKTQPYVQGVIEEINNLGFQLSPPDITKKQYNFDVDEENNCIRFGLVKVKSVTSTIIPALDNFLGVNYSTRLHVYSAAKSNKINITVLTALIRAGCLDKFSNDRSLMVLEAKTLYKFNEKELMWASRKAVEHNDLISLINNLKTSLDEKSKPIISERRLETIRKEYKKYKENYLQEKNNPKLVNWRWERSLLGYSFSQDLQKLFIKDFPELKQIKEVKQLDDAEGKGIIFICYIEECLKRISKNGNEYIQLLVRDETSSAKVLCFNDCYSELLKAEPRAGDILLVRGEKSGDIVFGSKIIIKDRGIKIQADDEEKKLEEEETSDEEEL